VDLSLSLRRAISVYGQHEAIFDQGVSYTYRQFGERVAALSHGLSMLGVKKGETVAIVCPNTHHYMEAYYACAVSGIVLNPLNFRLAAKEISTILADSNTRAIFVHHDFVELFKNAMSHGEIEGFKHVVFIGEGELDLELKVHQYETVISQNHGSALPDIAVASSDLAQLYYTSGTTGKAKGVMLTQENVASHALGSIPEFELSDADTWAHIGPMFHLVDAWAVFAATWVGARHVFAPYFKADSVLDLFEREKVSKTALVPTMLNALLNEPSVKDRSFPALKVITTAGSPVAPEIVKRTCETFGCHYWQFYGMTECSPLLTISKPKATMSNWPAEKLLAVSSRTGRTVIGVELKVVKDDGTEVKRDDAEIGEIVVRGPSITPGYWKQPDATNATIIDGWLHTGDLAVMDSEGYVNIVDRKKDMIITGGENVYSTEVEYALYEHPDVVECAVFGIPDQKWGEMVKAVVVKRSESSISEADVIAFVRSRLAAYKAPRTVDFIDVLPKTGSGKIYKKGLRDKYWEKEGRPIK
jgi:acyl-CoA synthetase (AMP-forming)/AMP-acid ligase II